VAEVAREVDRRHAARADLALDLVAAGEQRVQVLQSRHDRLERVVAGVTQLTTSEQTATYADTNAGSQES
jgi:hypothetical protein